MSEVDLIIITSKGVGEGKTEVFSDVPLLSRFSFEIVLLVDDIRSCSIPTNTVTCPFICAITQDSHSKIVQTIRLGEVQYIEAHFHTFACITYFKEIPLGVAVGVDVIL